MRRVSAAVDVRGVVAQLDSSQAELIRAMRTKGLRIRMTLSLILLCESYTDGASNVSYVAVKPGRPVTAVGWSETVRRRLAANANSRPSANAGERLYMVAPIAFWREIRPKWRCCLFIRVSQEWS